MSASRHSGTVDRARRHAPRTRKGRTPKSRRTRRPIGAPQRRLPKRWVFRPVASRTAPFLTGMRLRTGQGAPERPQPKVVPVPVRHPPPRTCTRDFPFRPRACRRYNGWARWGRRGRGGGLVTGAATAAQGAQRSRRRRSGTTSCGAARRSARPAPPSPRTRLATPHRTAFRPATGPDGAQIAPPARGAEGWRMRIASGQRGRTVAETDERVLDGSGRRRDGQTRAARRQRAVVGARTGRSNCDETGAGTGASRPDGGANPPLRGAARASSAAPRGLRSFRATPASRLLSGSWTRDPSATARTSTAGSKPLTQMATEPAHIHSRR